MLVIVVVVFAVCWLPYQTYQVGAMLFPPINQKVILLCLTCQAYQEEAMLYPPINQEVTFYTS
jgi:hypothetical protein